MRMQRGGFLLPLALLAAGCCMFLLCGCAVGRNPLTGGVVFGADLGRLAENTNQAVAAAVEQYLPGLGTLAGIAVPGLGGIATLAVGWARAHAKAGAATARKEGEDAGWAAAHGTAPDPGSTAGDPPQPAPVVATAPAAVAPVAIAAAAPVADTPPLTLVPSNVAAGGA